MRFSARAVKSCNRATDTDRMTVATTLTTRITARKATPPQGPIAVPGREILAPGGPGTLVLRRPEKRDRGSYLAALRASRAHLEPWYPLNEAGESDTAYVNRQIAQARASDAQRTDWRRCAFLPTGELVGVVNINRITRDRVWHASINWWVSAAHAGRGFGTAMCEGAIEHAFAEIPGGLQLDVLHAEIDDDNAASVRLAGKLGFVPDAVPAGGCSINGVWRAQTVWTLRRPAETVVARFAA